MKHETFAEVYERYATLIMKSVVAQTRDRQLAEEICQQTFLSYYKNMDTVKTEFVKAWLLHTAKNLLIDHWRKASTRREIPDSDGQIMEDAACPNDFEKQCADRQFLEQMLAELEAENRLWYEVVDCIYIREMSHEETAKLLRISPTALRARLYRAKRFLQARYRDDYHEG